MSVNIATIVNNEEHPEETVVITDISQLSPESQEIFRYHGWTLEKFQETYHNAIIFSHEPKKNEFPLFAQNADGRGYKFEDPEVVLKRKAKTGEDGITPEILPQLFGALAVRYLEPLKQGKNLQSYDRRKENSST